MIGKMRFRAFRIFDFRAPIKRLPAVRGIEGGVHAYASQMTSNVPRPNPENTSGILASDELLLELIDIRSTDPIALVLAPGRNRECT